MNLGQKSSFEYNMLYFFGHFALDVESGRK